MWSMAKVGSYRSRHAQLFLSHLCAVSVLVLLHHVPSPCSFSSWLNTCTHLQACEHVLFNAWPGSSFLIGMHHF